MNLLKNLQVTQIPAFYKQILKSVTSVRSGNPTEIVQNSAECSISKTWRSKSLPRCPSSVLSAVQIFSENLSSSTSALPQFSLKTPPKENSLTETVCSRFTLDMGRVNYTPNLMQCRQFSTLSNKSQMVTYKIRTKYRKYSKFSDFCSKLFNKKKKHNKSAKMEILPEKQEPNEKQARATPIKEGPDSYKKKKMMCVSKNQKPEKVCKAPKKKCVQPFGAEIVCPNPPKLGDDMSVPYYFKKVCVRSENGKCVRYEMQRVPMPDGIKKYQSPAEREKCALPDVPIPRNEGKLVTISELSSTVENVKASQCADCKLCNARKALSSQKPPKQPEKPPEKRDLCAKYRIKSSTCKLRKETESTKAAKEKKSSSCKKIKKKGSRIKKTISKVAKSKRVKIIKKSARKQLSKVIKIKPKMSKEAKEKLKQTQASRKEGKQPVWNPCEQIKKNASVIEQKAKRQSCSESSLCKKKKASVCDPCQKEKEEKPSVCDPCKKEKSSSESSLCKNLKKMPPVCNPCKKKEDKPVCDPCEKVKKKASICDNKAKSSSKGSICKNLKKKASPCDPCQAKKEKKASICDPTKAEVKDNDCSKQLKAKSSPVCDPCGKLSKEEPICKPPGQNDTKKKSICKPKPKKKKQGRPCPICYSKEGSTSFLSKKCPKFPFRCPGEEMKCKLEVVKVPRSESKESSPSDDPVKSTSTKAKGSQTTKSKDSAPSVPPNTPKKCSVYSNRSNTNIRMYHKRTGTDQTDECDSEPKVCESMLDELAHSDGMAHHRNTTEEDSYKSYSRKWRNSSSRRDYCEPNEVDKELSQSAQAMPKADTEEEDFHKPYRIEWTKSSSHYARSEVDGPQNLFEEVECDKFILEGGKEEENSHRLYRKKRNRPSPRHIRSETEVPEILLEELENDKYKTKRKQTSSRHSRSETNAPEISLEGSPQTDKMITKADTEEKSSSATSRTKWGESKRSKMITSDTVFEEVTESGRTMPKTDIEEIRPSRKTQFSEDARSQQDTSNSLLAKQVQSDKVIPNDNEYSSKTLGKLGRKSTSKNARSKPIVSDAQFDKVTQTDKVIKPDIVDDDEWNTLSLKSGKKKSDERLGLNKHKEGSNKPEGFSKVSKSLFRKLKREKGVSPCSRAGCDLCIARQTKPTCKPNIVCNPKLKKPPPCKRSPIISPDDIVFSKRYNICEDKKELINKPVKCVAQVCGATKTCPAVVPSSPKLCKPLRRHPPVDKCSLKAKSPQRSEPEPQTAEAPKHRKDIITNTICNQAACKKKKKASVCIRRHPPKPMKKERCRSKASMGSAKSRLSASRRVCSDLNKATYITRFGRGKKRSTLKQNVGKVTKGHVFGPLKELDQKKSSKQLSPEVGEKVDKGMIMNLKGLIDSVCKILCPMRKMGLKKDSSKSSIARPSSQTSIKKSTSKTKQILSDKKNDEKVAISKASMKRAEKESVQSAEKHDKKKEKRTKKSPTVTAKRSLCPFSKRARKERKSKRRLKMTDRKKQKTRTKND